MMGWLREMPRERADILLLLLAVAMVLAPHAGHFPPWLSVAAAVPLLWRAALTVRGGRQPPLGWLMLLAMLGISGVHISFGTLLGRDPGVAMLALLLSLKSLEMHGRRDVFVLVFICFFLLMANFFHAQGLLSAAWMLATVIVLLAALLSFHYGPAQPRWPARWRLLGRMLALALPLSALLFFMMPRLADPLWGGAGMGAHGTTGLSDSMQPGAIAQLALSDDPVFTAHFTTALPPQTALYWRGVVLGNYDGASWTRSAAPETQGKIDIALAGERLDYQVDLLPSGQRRIFALDLPRSIERLPGNPYVVSPALEVLTVQPIATAVRYRASSQIRYRLQAQLTPQQKQPWLALPPGANPRSLAWARQMRAGQPTQQAAIAAVLAHFSAAPFRYTLQPPLLGKDGVDDFLFRTRAGFCEHYAGSFVVLMRAMAIPARVVTGYQGGLRDEAAGSVTVRQSDAHAWSEVWLPDQGWIRIDPTSQVAPMRTERNLDAALPPVPARAGSWQALDTLGHAWQRAEQGWQRWVLDYTPERQRAMVDAVLALPARQVAIACALLAALAALAGALFWWRQRPGRHPGAALDQLYARFCRQQARRGHSRAPHEGPHGYAARLAASPASPRAHDAMARFLAIYAAMKYGNANPDEHTRARRTLRRLLTLCR
ncbi:DUF3488 and transglutaminase-like domain-containing protein [Janthinobacterium sp. J1-1]|uniref:transglutaminase TgpA family protein n=1 Tax=Janthinobacterium sp. J1-1 TaxID=3065910 RepID=UPI0028122DB0|nr:DUF3488 and transglutaminase-like domain-containing protein [Janthinobacterium sp. J1-1]